MTLKRQKTSSSQAVPDTSPRIEVVSEFKPAGDQPHAIDSLVDGVEAPASVGLAHQTLLGVTGSGKTFSIANVIERLQRPALVMAPNKTWPRSYTGSSKSFSQTIALSTLSLTTIITSPEAYVPASDTYIEKDSSVNARGDRQNKCDCLPPRR